MFHSPITDIMKGVALGMMAGIAVGCCGRKMYDEKPKLKSNPHNGIHARHRTLYVQIKNRQYHFLVMLPIFSVE